MAQFIASDIYTCDELVDNTNTLKETIFKKPLKGTHHCPTASIAMYLKLFLHTIFFFITNVNEACDKSKVWNMSNGVSEKNLNSKNHIVRIQEGPSSCKCQFIKCSVKNLVTPAL
jgi:hypothetical protein